MKEKILINARIIDPSQNLDILGGLIINEEGLIEAVGKKVNENNIPSREKFVNLKQSKNEINQRLEQLRAFDNNIEINVILANSTPIGVDTEEDFMELKKIMNYKN